MQPKLKTGIALSLIPQIILVKWLGNHPAIVETYYSEGIYPIISKFLRIIFGWIPFSIGDVIYFVFVFFVFQYVWQNTKLLLKKPLHLLRDVLYVFSIVYFSFHLLWGMNYYRVPITEKLNIQEEYSLEALIDFTEYLVEQSNRYQYQITSDSTQAVQIPYSKKEIFDITVDGYTSIEGIHPFLAYHKKSIKASLFSEPLSYMGYGGYINPFTNEAQVNGKVPLFRLPTIAGHEIGHQTGYSAEDATNFIGFLVTVKNKDPYFKYASYSNSLRYCLHDLAKKDKEKFDELVEKLNPGVKKNYKEVRTFWEGYENFTEPIFESIFNSFLKANNQEKGIQSYNAVVGLLVNYHDSYHF